MRFVRPELIFLLRSALVHSDLRIVRFRTLGEVTEFRSARTQRPGRFPRYVLIREDSYLQNVLETLLHAACNTHQPVQLLSMAQIGVHLATLKTNRPIHLA